MVTFEGLPCVSTLPFTGTVSGLALEGSATDEDSGVLIEIDGSQAMLEISTRLEGSFTIQLGTAVEDEPCVGLVGDFVAFLTTLAVAAEAPTGLRVGAPRRVPLGGGEALAWPLAPAVDGSAPRRFLLQPLESR